MDKAIETQLSLYLDGLLPDEERRAFEARMEKDAELRRAVALHREAAAEMGSVPELPAGFTARARVRLEQESAAAAAPWWHRFWSLETAGVLVSAGIMMLAIVPFLLQRDREVEEILVAQKGTPRQEPATPRDLSTPGMQEAALDKEKAAPVPTATVPGRNDAATEETAAEISGDKSDHLAALGYLDDEDDAPEILKEEALGADHPELQSKKRAAAPRTEGRGLGKGSEDGEPTAPEGAGTDDSRAAAEEPAAEPGLKLEISSAEFRNLSARERALAKQALQVADAGGRIRSIPIAGTVRLNDSGFIVVRTESELSALLAGAGERPDDAGQVDGQAGDEDGDDFRYPATAGGFIDLGDSLRIDFDRDMGILLPARRDTPEPVRVEVVAATPTETTLVIFYKESPFTEEEGDPTSSAPMQLVIVPASDLPIRLRKLG